MAQTTTGIRSILGNPWVYEWVQRAMGATKLRRFLVEDFIRPCAGDHVLDIGCGPADVLNFMPAVKYHGFDISQEYIRTAQEKFSGRAHFHCKVFEEADLAYLPRFDIAVAIGVLHHLDDAEARNLMGLLSRALKPGGRLITIDPCVEPNQNAIARLLIGMDRGQNVRSLAAYRSLLGHSFTLGRAVVRHQSWIPYTHCLMECQAN
jgi:SAM-dependent methyltransferase